MKKNILIVGNDPKIISGVTNYTRPLGEELKKQGFKVSHLFSSSFAENFDYGKMRIEKTRINNINYFKLINSKGLVFNYDQLKVDHTGWFDFIFKNILKEYNIDIVHINEMYGFSSNIIKIAKSKKIKVFVTVHEYWWLCPHKVMIDFNGKICEGPESITKCSYCVYKKIPHFNTLYLKNNYRIKTVFPSLHKILSKLKSILKKNDNINLDLNNEKVKVNEKTKIIKKEVYNRLKANIKMLNNADKIICVSSDVKKTLTKYGVHSKKCLVNHIGSLVASKSKKIIKKKINSKNINFGFIGGVGYYKGLHVLIKAYQNLSHEEKMKSEVNIYGLITKNYSETLNNLINKIDIKFKKRLKLHGKYNSSSLDSICNSFDISVIPSLCADTAPQTIFESFSYKKPIIAPKIGGFPDFIKHKKNGLIYKSGDHKALSKLMSYIIKNPKKINEYKKNINASKTMKKNVEELAMIYGKKNVRIK